jgi:hypothetical protein
MTGLILAALFAITQTPSPIHPKALDSPTATAQTVTKNPKNDKAPSTQPPTSVGPSSADQQHVGSTTKSEDTEQAIRVRELPRVSITKDWSDWGIWAFNGLLVIVGAFQLLVLWRQAKIMKAQAGIMAEHAAHLKGLVTAAGDNAKAASAAAEAASKNADFSKLNAEATSQNAIAAKASADALVNAERAWVVAELVPICVQFGNLWHRPAGSSWASLTTVEVTKGEHLRHKLKFTNMGRTPAHILRYQIGYSREVEKTDIGLRMVGDVKRPEIEFDRLLGGNDSVEVKDIDVAEYIRDSIKEIGDSEATGILSGWVKYQHVFSDTDVVNVPFVYLYVPSAEQLRRVPLPRPEKGKEKKQSLN